jgi:hypothetical protein
MGISVEIAKTKHKILLKGLKAKNNHFLKGLHTPTDGT